jgi:hypothetical protein
VTYLAKRLGWRTPDRIRLTNLMLSDFRVNLRTPFNDRVDLLISLRFSYRQGSSHSFIIPGSKLIILYYH